MSYNIAYKKQQKRLRSVGYNPLPGETHWYVLKDKAGKVRDWVSASDAVSAKRLFSHYRDYNSIPKGYTVERRGPVTRENW